MFTLHSDSKLGGLIRFFAHSKVTPLLVITALLAGLFALLKLPREEEPQIVVPIFDIFVPFPGVSAQEIEKRILDLGERKLWEIPGVEYIYSQAEPNRATFIVRFKVGQDNERSLINLYAKVYSNLDSLPMGAGQPLIKQRSIDDVPFLALTFDNPQQSPVELRRAAAALRQEIQAIPNVSEVTLIGGRKRQFQVFLDDLKLREHLVSPGEIARLIQDANRRIPAGHLETSPLLVKIESDAFILTRADLENLVVSVSAGRPVYLKDVARVTDGPDEEEHSVDIDFRGASKNAPFQSYPAVTMAVAKRKGANATALSNVILKKVESLRGHLIPVNTRMTVTRDYGHTAAEKSNELLFHMGLAIMGVTLLIAFFLGLRAAGVVAVAIPVTLALTLFTFHFLGYTINRITLFALIFTIGILVDDPIVVVENIIRRLGLATNRGKTLLVNTVEAVLEIISPLFLATLAVIAAILPMASVGDLMGPYMMPIPIGASAAMVFSLLVSLLITPWASMRLLKKAREDVSKPGSAPHVPSEGWMNRLYHAYMNPLIYKPKTRKRFLITLAALLLGSLTLFPLQAVKMKMLPFDNKDEFQVILNMPEGTPLERTRTVLEEMRAKVMTLPEARNVVTYAGTASPYNFNGLVRHYFLRNLPHQGDLQVNLAPKNKRKRQSHAVAESIRPAIQEIAQRAGGYAQVAEIPPGPPVLSTLVLEIYGPDHAERAHLARKVENILRSTQGITDVATYEQSDEPLSRYVVDQQKASLNGIPVGAIADAMAIGVGGRTVGLAHVPAEDEPVDILLRLPKEKRASPEAMLNLQLLSRYGQSIPLKDLVAPQALTLERAIYHKNLMRVSYVLADVTDELGSPFYAIGRLQSRFAKLKTSDGRPLEIFFTHPPSRAEDYALKWDGEWHISYEVFRDLGISFAAVLALIFVLVVGWFQSFKAPVIVMLPIPLSMVGILPAHWLTGIFFSATSMIGMIAGAGIVVRNAIILVDFIELRLAEGHKLEDAVIEAGAVRFRPMLLTAAAVAIGASVLLFDPIFKGLALSLIAGEMASTLLSRTAVPVLYYMMMRKKPCADFQTVLENE